MLFDQIAKNKRKTWLLLFLFFLILGLIGSGIGYLWIDSPIFGVVLALIIGVVYAIIMISQSTTLVMRMNGARQISEAEAPDLYRVVEDMALAAQIPIPKVYIIEDRSLNAFATGPNPKNAAVAATRGLLEVMNREELEAVMGHEVAHIANYDIRLSTIAVALSAAISMLASIGSRMMFYGGGSSRRRSSKNSDGLGIIFLLISIVSIFLAPLAATLVQMAISRQREFLADATSVRLTRNPYGMIRALQKLDTSAPMEVEVNDASAALFINDPKRKSTFQKLFYTHPPIAERIARLERM